MVECLWVRGGAPVADHDLAIGVGPATRASWVTSTTAAALSRAAAVNSRITSSPLSESSGSVGSSAKTTRGPVTSARATPTRWLWPPEISPEYARHVGDFEAIQPLQHVPLGRPPPDALQAQRQRDVLHATQLRDELPELKDEPELTTAQGAAPRVAHARRPSKLDATGLRRDDFGQAVQRRRLTRARRAHVGDDLTGGEFEARPHERVRRVERLA